MPNVLNQRISGRPKGSVYIGRPGFWGNPFLIKKDGSNRAEVIARYERWLCDSPEGKQRMRRIGELRGRDLVCWCAPLPCHGDILLRLANAGW